LRDGQLGLSRHGETDWIYEWDWADRLVKVTSNGVVVQQNWYDANSRRIAKQELLNGQLVKTLYLFDGWDIIAVMNAQGQLLESYTRGVGLAGDIGTIAAVTHHAGSGVTPGTYYTHHNHRGDVIITRSGTTTVGTYEYAAFGNLKSSIANDVCRFKFSSKELDRSTGFYYYGYRFYAPQWQRWISRDLIEEKGGNNLYVFANNCPLIFVDPLGLKFLVPPGMPCWMARALWMVRAALVLPLAKRFAQWKEAVGSIPDDPAKVYWVELAGPLGTISWYDQEANQIISWPAYRRGPIFILILPPKDIQDEIRRRLYPPIEA